jgi:LysR family glycine cleavage system transcriptional activator
MADPLATIPLSAVRVFEAAARLGSFTRAADELGVTQAAVSWQVKALETRIGQPLFRRQPREVTLTPAGERLSRAASEAMNLLRVAFADLSDAPDAVLSITTMDTFAIQWLAPRIGAFQLSHPKIAVRLEVSSAVQDLARDGFDVAIRSGSGDWRGLESHRLFARELTPLCAPGVRDALGGLVDPAALLDAPLIGERAAWSAWFAAVGLARPGAETTSPLIADVQTVAVTSALAGRGVALGSPVLFADQIAAGVLVRPFPTVIVENAGYWLIYPRQRRPAPKIEAFRAWMMETIARDAGAQTEAG